MKKWICLLAAAALLAALSACGAKTPTEPTTKAERPFTTPINEFYDLYGCPNSKRTAKLQLKKSIHN